MEGVFHAREAERADRIRSAFACLAQGGREERGALLQNTPSATAKNDITGGHTTFLPATRCPSVAPHQWRSWHTPDSDREFEKIKKTRPAPIPSTSPHTQASAAAGDGQRSALLGSRGAPPAIAAAPPRRHLLLDTDVLQE